jgi:hypothetical protein
MSAIPIINQPNVNLGYANLDNTQASQILADQFHRDWDIFQYCLGKIEASALVEVVTLPSPIGLPDATVSGVQPRKSSLVNRSIVIGQTPYNKAIAIDATRLHGASDSMQDVLMQQLNQIANSDYASYHIQSEAVKSLIKNETRTYDDGCPVFYSSHPVDPNNSRQTSRTTGLTTFKNLYTSSPFSLANVLNVATIIRNLCWQNGVACSSKKVTIAVTPQNAALAAHIFSSEYLGFGSAFSSSDTVATQSNPLSALKKDGWSFDFIVLSEYPVAAGAPATDWYAFTGILNPFIIKVLEWPKVIPRQSDNDPNMVEFNEMQNIYKATFGATISDPRAIVKFTA